MSFPGQPLREAVSWNTLSIGGVSAIRSSASSWGCELKYRGTLPRHNLHWSASSWGCELKCVYRWSAVHDSPVSLFVRLWVEMLITISLRVTNMSASSWGCELKYADTDSIHCDLQSASSWGCELKYLSKYTTEVRYMSASSWGCELKCGIPGSNRWLGKSASSWGCELKFLRWNQLHLQSGQPLREAVSWNKYLQDMYSFAAFVVSVQ